MPLLMSMLLLCVGVVVLLVVRFVPLYDGVSPSRRSSNEITPPPLERDMEKQPLVLSMMGQGAHPRNVESIQRVCKKQNITFKADVDPKADFKWFPGMVVPENMHERSLVGPHVFMVIPDDHTLVGDNQLPGKWTMLCDWNCSLQKDRQLPLRMDPEPLPFGVDTTRFCPLSIPTYEWDVILYTKHRRHEDVQKVRLFLDDLRVKEYVYGEYDWEQYHHDLLRSKSIIFVIAHESQGFAVQEAMACNVPCFVWNVQTVFEECLQNNEWDKWQPLLKGLATSVPYWHDICGEQVTSIKDFKVKWKSFWENVNAKMYHPRLFVLDQLTDTLCFNRLFGTDFDIQMDMRTFDGNKPDELVTLGVNPSMSNEVALFSRYTQSWVSTYWIPGQVLTQFRPQNMDVQIKMRTENIGPRKVCVVYQSSIFEPLCHVVASTWRHHFPYSTVSVHQLSQKPDYDPSVFYIGVWNGVPTFPHHFACINTEAVKEVHCDHMKRCYDNALFVLDYSKSFREWYSCSNNVFYCPFGVDRLYLWDNEFPDKNIDVLFYGCISERRVSLWNSLKEKLPQYTMYWPNFEENKSVYGSALHELINRSEIVLSIRFYDTDGNDLFRISPLIVNGVFVLCERYVDSDLYDTLDDMGIVFDSLDSLVDRIAWFLSQEGDRRKTQNEVKQWFAKSMTFRDTFPIQDVNSVFRASFMDLL